MENQQTPAELKEYYKGAFMDVFCGADDDIHQEAIIESFLEALSEWLGYHIGQATRYQQMQERVISALNPPQK